MYLQMLLGVNKHWKRHVKQQHLKFGLSKQMDSEQNFTSQAIAQSGSVHVHAIHVSANAAGVNKHWQRHEKQ